MKKFIRDRHDHIIEACRGKKVLHIGCIGNSYKSTSKYEPWLHKEISDASSSCIGVDLYEERIREAEQLSNSTIIFGDASNFDLHDTFDVIVAGEIIEHIDNFASFFATVRRHSTKDTVIILTTPNPFNFSNLIRTIFTGKPIFDPDHVVYFDIFTLGQMLRRQNFIPERFIYNTEVAPQRIRNIIIRGLGVIFPILNLNLMVIAKCVESPES